MTSDAIDRLNSSPSYPRICQMLHALPKWNADTHPFSLEMAIHRGLAGPRAHERLTKSERLKTAEKISSTAQELASLLRRIHGDQEIYRDWPPEFQGLLDGLALEAALDFQERVGKGNDLADALADESCETFHATRFGIYHLLMEGMPEVLETLSDGAKWWGESGRTPLAKPNHKNAMRLYFLRTLTSAFVGMFGRPLRELTLEITSIYFDCSDLVEADLSNLAPVRRRRKSTND